MPQIIKEEKLLAGIPSPVKATVKPTQPQPPAKDDDTGDLEEE